MNSHVVLVVGGTGEGASTGGLGAVVRPLAGVCSDVDFSDVGGGERPATAFNWAFKRLLSWKREQDVVIPLLDLHHFTHLQNKQNACAAQSVHLYDTWKI